MSEFKGTSGPWIASKYDRSIGPLFKDDDQSYGMILPVAWAEFDGDKERYQANTNLISAAPELLEALQNLMDNYREFREKQGRADYPSNPLIQAAHDAINKALGK